MKFVAIGMGVFGKGDTAAHAVKNLLWEKKVKAYVVYRVEGDDGAEIDMNGRLCAVQGATVTLVKRVGRCGNRKV